MKNLKTVSLSVLLSIVFMNASAQGNSNPPVHEPDYNQPKLFADAPQKFNVDLTVLESLLSIPVGETVNVPLTGTFRLIGNVVSKSDPIDPKVKSVVIRSTNRLGATMTFTRVTKEDGSYSYLGRIISYKNSDAYEFAQENGSYVLVKKHLYDLFNE
jgi:hypothetical protein